MTAIPIIGAKPLAMPAFHIRASATDAMQPGALHIDPSRLARGAVVENDFAFARRLLFMLNQRYPGHRWVVEVNTKQGVAYVRNFFADPRRGYCIHLARCTGEADVRRQVLIAGGELLERYGIKGAAFREESYEHIWMKNHPGVPKNVMTTDTKIAKRIAW